MQEAEQIDRIEAVRARVRDGRDDPHVSGAVDPYDVREATRDNLKGEHEKNTDVWAAGMRHHGFVWYSPRELDRYVGLEQYIPQHLAGVLDATGRPIANSSLYATRPHTEGQWRRDRPHSIPIAFTVTDLVSLFRVPDAFDRWLVGHERTIRAQRAGVIVPR